MLREKRHRTKGFVEKGEVTGGYYRRSFAVEDSKPVRKVIDKKVVPVGRVPVLLRVPKSIPATAVTTPASTTTVAIHHS